MSSASPPTLPGRMTLLDKLSLSWLVPVFVCHWLANFTSRCIPGSSSLHWRQKLAISNLQSLRRSLNPRQLFALSRAQLTGEAVKAYCHARGLPYTAITVPLPEKAPGGDTVDVPPPVLHVVTPANAPARGPTLLYAHGGGTHPLALRCAAACGARSVVFIEYSLSSEHAWCKWSPRSSTFSTVVSSAPVLTAGLAAMLTGPSSQETWSSRGDSAGGHLIASLLAHVVRPSPYAPPLAELGGEKRKQLRAVVLLSPWVTMRTSDASFTANSANDYLSAQQANVFIRLFRPAAGEVWACPSEGDGAVELWRAAFPPTSSSASASPGKSEAAGAVAKKMLVTVGMGETLLDSCVRFGRELLGAETVVLDADTHVKGALVGGKDVVLTVAPGEAHVQPALDCAVRYEHGATLNAIMAFLKSV
ncbi:hypothetical protein ACCO45_002221 [Purpureocillium lilacinum]|uniref:Uncharacterized protein n=1 Tax=Purpureocillium lilacinum TaxID=33203 RepID=A0ACC4EAE7_PURLI